MACILIVDDEASIRSLLQIFLQREGHHVEVASDAESAIRMVQQHHVDLIITDIFLPGMDGLELIRNLRRSFPHVKIIALSGGSRRVGLNPLEEAKALGAAAGFDKPVDIFKFSDAIQAVLAGATSP
jgi:CheY-like chemotaxis protein